RCEATRSRTPYREQATWGVGREVGKARVAGAGSLFVGPNKQVRPANLNIAPPVSTLPNGKSFFGFGKLDPNAGIYYYTDNSGNSAYHGLTLTAAARHGRSLRLNANYTLSKTLDDGTFTVFVSTPQDLYHRSQERATSIQDVRHRFVANFTAAGADDSLLRGFELSGILPLQPPRPFTTFAGFDATADTNPVPARVGLAARNPSRGDSFKSLALRLPRPFGLGDARRKLQLIAEVFNVFNRVN